MGRLPCRVFLAVTVVVDRRRESSCEATIGGFWAATRAPDCDGVGDAADGAGRSLVRLTVSRAACRRTKRLRAGVGQAGRS